MQWFLAACLFHSLVDIVTHHDDGPLLLWPLEWTLRYESPVSYWDHQFHGNNFFIFEVILDLLLVMMLVGICLCRRRRGSADQSPRSGENAREFGVGRGLPSRFNGRNGTLSGKFAGPGRSGHTPGITMSV